ncbi:MAG: hypothetical protein L0207_06655 [Chlamydiae bacterium]|nr:hypothetical protein [Chlamydiota bacterium]
MKPLEVIDTGKASATKNMELDRELLVSLEGNPRSILHFYDWIHPSITHGYFINPQKHLHLEAIDKFKLDLARRPTGGGIVFHIWDLAFSILVPSNSPYFSSNSLKNYNWVNGQVLSALQQILGKGHFLELVEMEEKIDLSGFCMAKPTKYDLTIKGKKIVGAAQRKNRYGFLHQGTISIAKPDYDLLQKLLIDSSLLSRIEATSFFIMEDRTERKLASVRNQIKEELTKTFKNSPYTHREDE